MWRYSLPLIVLVLLLVLLAIGLTRDPTEVPSPLIGKPTPQFKLPLLHDSNKTISSEDFKDQVSLLNVWASWCASCRHEHSLLLDITKSGLIPVYGLNYKDQRNDALNWLKELGNPYKAVAYDLQGRVGLDFGVYGAPESYLIDQNGVIVYKKIGPITSEDWQNKILPFIKSLQEG